MPVRRASHGAAALAAGLLAALALTGCGGTTTRPPRTAGRPTPRRPPASPDAPPRRLRRVVGPPAPARPGPRWTAAAPGALAAGRDPLDGAGARLGDDTVDPRRRRHPTGWTSRRPGRAGRAAGRDAPADLRQVADLDAAGPSSCVQDRPGEPAGAADRASTSQRASGSRSTALGRADRQRRHVGAGEGHVLHATVRPRRLLHRLGRPRLPHVRASAGAPRRATGFNAARITPAGDTLLTFDDSQPSLPHRRCASTGATVEPFPGVPRCTAWEGAGHRATAPSGR